MWAWVGTYRGAAATDSDAVCNADCGGDDQSDAVTCPVIKSFVDEAEAEKTLLRRHERRESGG